MNAKRRRKPDNELHYTVSIHDWYAHSFFNEYCYANIFDSLPYEDRNYMVLQGTLQDTFSKKVKKGMSTEIVAHPGDYSHSRSSEDEIAPIGDMEVYRHEKEGKKLDHLMFRVSIPEKAFEHIRAYLSYKARGEVSVVGTDFKYRKGHIYYFSFDGGRRKRV